MKMVPEGENKCIWMEAGVVSYKLCNNQYNCMSCNFDQGMARKAKEERLKVQETDQDKPRIEEWTKKFLELPASQRKCRYMLMGATSFKLCPNAFQCGDCAYDQMMQDRIPPTIPLKVGEAPLVLGFQVPDNFYYHRGHGWAHNEYAGRIRVGLDDFSTRLMGKVDELQLPRVGQKVSQGSPTLSLKRKGKVVEGLSPINGVVTHVNSDAYAHPEVVNHAPYEEGWLFLVEPLESKSNLKSLLYGEEAQNWINDEAERLLGEIHTSIGPTAFDGGLPAPDMSAALKGKKWRELVRSFLLT
jgi:glycine cleavage system H lipoate-binding protein